MSKVLEAIFKLVDQASGPGSKIASALSKIDQMGSKAGGSAQQLFGKIGEMAEAAKPGLAAIGEVVKFVGEALLAAAAAASALAIEIGKSAVESAEFERKALIGLQAIEGTHEAAESTLKSLQQMADAVGVPDEQLVQVYENLKGIGFAADDAKTIIAAMMDVTAVKGQAAGDAVAKLFEKIKASGEFKFEAKEFVAAGISEEQVAKAIQTMDGFKNKTVQQIEAMMKAGQIKADVGSKAILLSIQQNLDQGQGLGTTAMNVAGGDPAAQFQVLKNEFDRMLASIDLSPIIDLIKQFQAALASPEGKQAMQAITSSFSEMGPIFKEIFTPGNIHAVIKLVEAFIAVGKAVGGGVVKALVAMFGPLRDVINLSDNSSGGFTKMLHGFMLIGEVIGGAIAALIYGIGAIGAIIGALVEVIYEAGAAIGSFFVNTLPGWFSSGWNGIKAVVQDVINWFKGLPDTFASIGTAIVAALTGSLVNGAQSVGLAGKNLGDTLSKSTKDSLQVKSPSKVFEGIGSMTIQGFHEGLDKSSNDNAVTDAMGVPDKAPSVGGASGGGGGSNGGGNVINVNFNAGAIVVGSGGGDPKTTGVAVAKSIHDEVVDIFEDMGLRAGATGGG